MLSKRANIFYLEKCRVMQRDECVVYLNETGQDIESIFNIPDKNTMFLMLGTGTSITNSAMRKLSESNVVVGFVGGGGSPLIAATDISFVLPQDEYRPTEYMQAWMRIWCNESSRIDAGRRLLKERMQWSINSWAKSAVAVPPQVIANFEFGLDRAGTTTQLLSAEARWAKDLYRTLADTYGVKFKREEGKGSNQIKEDTINGLIDHGNYLAYGYAATTLHCLGIPFAMPVLHGKTRRGGLVFDIADLVKDELVLPVAFEIGSGRKTKKLNNEFRAHIIEKARNDKVVDRLFALVEGLCKSQQHMDPGCIL